MIKKRDAQLKARQEWAVQHQLIWHHKVLVGHIARLYARAPRNEAELRNAAEQLLKNPAGLDEILKRYHDTLHAE